MILVKTPLQTRFKRHVAVEPNTGCWLWNGAKHYNGYGAVFVGPGKKGLAHRIAWELHRGPIPKAMLVLHRCDCPGCVNPDHLFLGTQADNLRDMDQKGRRVNGGERLTVPQVGTIRARLASGEIGADLAREFCCSKATVSRIRTQHAWRHIP